jgi:uncharacterized protein (DUF111 family)
MRVGSSSVRSNPAAVTVVQAAPEFESCKAVAERAGIPLKQVYAAALRARKR